MFNTGIKKLLKIAICVSMAVTIVPSSFVHVLAKNIFSNSIGKDKEVSNNLQKYTQTFDTDDISNWKRQIGAGTYKVVNQALDVKTAGWVAGSVDYQLIYDDASPVLSNGVVSADIDNLTGNGRFGFVFHYANSDNYDYVGYDVAGQWSFVHRVEGKETSKNIFNEDVDNKKFNLKIAFQETQIEVFIDGVSRYTGNDLSEDSKGKMGIKTWGYTDNYAHISVDNIQYNEAPTLEHDDAGNYMVSFTDENKRGGWQKVDGNGTINFTDGVKDAGYMSIVANGDTYYEDMYAPKLDNGFLEADVTNLSDGRFALLTRYNGSNDFSGFGYDVDGWHWFAGNGAYSPDVISSQKMEDGVRHKVRIEYMGTTLSLFVNGTKLASVQDSQFVVKKGTIGIRAWGYGSGLTQGSIKVDNVKNGKLNAVLLSPDRVSINYAEAGDYAISTKFSQTENTFVSVAVNGVALQVDKDYTRNDALDTLTFTKAYLASIKDTTDTLATLTFHDGFQTSFTIHIVEPETQVDYRRDFGNDGIDHMTKVKGDGTLTFAIGNKTANFANDALYIDEHSKDMRNGEVEYTFQQKNDTAPYGIVLRYAGSDDYTMIGLDSQNPQHASIWRIATAKGTIKTFPDGVFMLSDRDKPYKVKVRVIEDVVTIFLDNEEIFSEEIPGISDSKGKMGILTTKDAQVNVSNMKQHSQGFLTPVTTPVQATLIQNDKVSVHMDNAFPRVIDYTLANGISTQGQEKPIYNIEVNNMVYKPKVHSEFRSDGVTYHVSIDERNTTFDVVYTLRKNALKMEINAIKDDTKPIYTFHFPDQVMVSMTNEDGNAELRTNDYINENVMKLADVNVMPTFNTTTLAVLSNGKIAASINNGSIKNNHEVTYQSVAVDNHISTGLASNEYIYRGLDGKVIEEPWSVVAISGDKNGDGSVDYQDGAIARRDDCYKDEASKNRVGSTVVTNSMEMIAMNVGSEAQYPFLRILDDIKKFDLGTDGFKQNIIIKGYQGEGHDSMHPDFANYNTRAGGLNDLNTLLDNAGNYNATVGVHINDTDIYPEAPEYGKLRSNVGGWSWYDDSAMIKRGNDDLDTSDKGLDARLQKLISDTNNKLSMIYVDVFFGTRWPMYKLTSNINSKNIAIGTEYVDVMDKDSVFAHHIGSQYNAPGNLVRFVNNTQQDIFGNSDLFRGANDRNYSTSGAGFYGWQGAVNYNQTLEAFYTKILPNKYLTNFPISIYKDANQATLGDHQEVVTKMKNGKNVILKDGKVIADGNTIFIPWNPKTEEKIYHYNENGGSTTWDLPNSWKGVSSIDVYPLSDEGKGQVVNVPVVNGQVRIDATAKQGYVIYKNTTKKNSNDSAQSMNWSTGSPVKDMGFDSHSFTYWTPSSKDNVEISNNAIGNTHLYIKGTKQGSVTQTLTGLTPGKTYSASVWTQVDGKKAEIRVVNGSDVESNYMERSNVTYGIHHSDKYGAKTQRVRVVFTAQGKTAQLYLKAGTGDKDTSNVDFDDVRVFEIKKTDALGNTYYEDFEDMDQAYGIFVSTEADNTHLSQRNDPYTKDVVDGTYSLKIRAGDYMRTLPSTLRLKPNTKYSFSMKYKDLEKRNATAFTVGVKSDLAKDNNDTKNTTVISKGAVSNPVSDVPETISFDFTTGPYDDYYVDVTKDQSNSYALDDVAVNEYKEINKDTLQKLVDDSTKYVEANYTPDSYRILQDMIKKATAVLQNTSATMDEITKAYTDLDTAVKNLIAYAKEEDKTILQNVITQMGALLSNDYKNDENWSNFQSVLAHAKDLVNKDTVTVPEINMMIQSLNDAKAALVRVVDVDILRNLITKASALSLSDFKDDKPRQNFISTLALAKIVIDKPGVSQSEIDDMVTKLKTDKGNLTPLKQWKESYVKTLLREIDNLQEAYYTPSIVAQIKSLATSLQTLVNDDGSLLSALETNKTKVEALLTKKNTYTVQLVSSLPDAGTLYGQGTFAAGTATSLIAKPNVGYTFDGWYIKDQKVSDGATYNLVVEADVTATAHFTKTASGLPDKTYSVSVSASEGGTIHGGGIFHENDKVVLHAIPQDGYLFEGYEVNGILVATAPNYEFQVTQDVQVRGLFEKIKTVPIEDTIAPSMPINIKVIKKDANTISIAWDASKDNVGVAGYEVSVNGKSIGVSKDTNIAILHLSPNTTYRIEVRAFDATMNYSPKNMLLVTTDKGKADTNKNESIMIGTVPTADTANAVAYIGIALCAFVLGIWILRKKYMMKR